MAKLVLDPRKSDGSTKLQLGLAKSDEFTVELYWDSEHDLDGHALLCHNNGNGAKVSRFEDVLSIFTAKKQIRYNASGKRTVYNTEGAQAVLETRDDPNSPDDGEFWTPGQAAIHSADREDGRELDIDETLTFNGSAMEARVNEIPIIINVHEGGTFRDVKDAGLKIKAPNGSVVAEYNLSDGFAEFDSAHVGSLVVVNNSWEYQELASGFDGGINTALDTFS